MVRIVPNDTYVPYLQKELSPLMSKVLLLLPVLLLPASHSHNKQIVDTGPGTVYVFLVSEFEFSTGCAVS